MVQCECDVFLHEVGVDGDRRCRAGPCRGDDLCSWIDDVPGVPCAGRGRATRPVDTNEPSLGQLATDAAQQAVGVAWCPGLRCSSVPGTDPCCRTWERVVHSVVVPSDEVANVLAEIGAIAGDSHATGRDAHELARVTGISRSTLSRLESGPRRPSLELLLPFAEAFRVPLDEPVGAPEVGDPRIRLRPQRRGGRVVVPARPAPARDARVERGDPPEPRTPSCVRTRVSSGSTCSAVSFA